MFKRSADCDDQVVKPGQLGFAMHLLRRYDCVLLLSWAFVNILG